MSVANKAIAGFFTSLVTLLAVFNVDIGAWSRDPETLGAIASILGPVLTGLVVYFVPNKVRPEHVNAPSSTGDLKVFSERTGQVTSTPPSHALLVAIFLLPILAACVTPYAPPAVGADGKPVTVTEVQKAIASTCGLRATVNTVANLLLSFRRDSGGLLEGTSLVNAAVLGACTQLGYSSLKAQGKL
jgi:hypothetical protein